jgi:tRNA dimethylallyltransferase
MRCVGYRQAWQHLNGAIDREQLLEQGIAATRQLAKRQLTWLRAMENVAEFDCLTPDADARILDYIRQELEAHYLGLEANE